MKKPIPGNTCQLCGRYVPLYDEVSLFEKVKDWFWIMWWTICLLSIPIAIVKIIFFL